jgi:hypothetical protein
MAAAGSPETAKNPMSKPDVIPNEFASGMGDKRQQDTSSSLQSNQWALSIIGSNATGDNSAGASVGSIAGRGVITDPRGEVNSPSGQDILPAFLWAQGLHLTLPSAYSPAIHTSDSMISNKKLIASANPQQDVLQFLGNLEESEASLTPWATSFFAFCQTDFANRLELVLNDLGDDFCVVGNRTSAGKLLRGCEPHVSGTNEPRRVSLVQIPMLDTRDRLGIHAVEDYFATAYMRPR